MNKPYSQTIIWHPIYPGSKNPPLDTPLFIKNSYGTGYGRAFKDYKGVYFDYYSERQTLLGKTKLEFLAWAIL